MAGVPCPVCGETMKVSGKKKPYLGCPNGCAQVMIRKNVEQFEAKYGKGWKGNDSSGPAAAGASSAPKPASPTATGKETDRGAQRAKSIDEEILG